MNILALEYNIEHQALEVYVAGCTRHCPGCHNPETWSFDQGKACVHLFRRIERILQLGVVKQIWVMGGEPLDQPMPSLLAFLMNSLIQSVENIVLWTGYEEADVPEEIFEFVDAIKVGGYEKDTLGSLELVPGGTDVPVELASCNQGFIEGLRGCA